MPDGEDDSKCTSEIHLFLSLACNGFKTATTKLLSGPSLCKGRVPGRLIPLISSIVTVNPLLGHPVGLFISNSFDRGLNRDGGLI